MPDRSDPIRIASGAESSAATATLVAAFLTDPMARFTWPSVEDHLRHMPSFTVAFGGRSFAHDSAFVSDDLAGVALWLPPGEHPDEEALEQLMRETAEPSHLDDLRATFERMGQCHPEEPHWYLPLIGVEPFAQGRGLGAALLRTSLARCDEAGLPAYLESSNPRNVPLYQRHGFEVLGTIQQGAAPLVTPMLRRPRRG